MLKGRTPLSSTILIYPDHRLMIYTEMNEKTLPDDKRAGALISFSCTAAVDARGENAAVEEDPH